MPKTNPLNFGQFLGTIENLIKFHLYLMKLMALIQTNFSLFVDFTYAMSKFCASLE